MGVEVDHPGQHDPRPEVDRAVGQPRRRDRTPDPTNAIRPAASTSTSPSAIVERPAAGERRRAPGPAARTAARPGSSTAGHAADDRRAGCDAARRRELVVSTRSVDRDRLRDEARASSCSRSRPASRRGRSRRRRRRRPPRPPAARRRSSRRGSPPASPGPAPRSGTALIAASTPDRRVGRDLVHRLERRPDEARDRVVLRRRPSPSTTMMPGPGQRRDRRRRGGRSPASRRARAGPARCSRSRSPRRPRPAATAAPWPKSGYSTIVDVVRREARPRRAGPGA